MTTVVLLVWAAVMVVGLTASGVAAGKALASAEVLADRAGLSPFVVGLTVMAIGTDLPEIANSIIASASGHGDLAVGDGTGSAITQITFILGLLCLFRPIRVERAFAASAGFFTAVALVVAGMLMRDGNVSRIDALVLIGLWLLMTLAVSRTAPRDRTAQRSLFDAGARRQVVLLLAALSVVGGGAVAAITAFSEITEGLGIPEYVTSFFVLSVGTSLPELIVDGRAIRHGAGALALGDLLGSSLVDATLSLGIGPLLFPIEVSASAASGTLITAVAVAAVVMVLLRRRDHGRLTGVILLGCYAALFPVMILR